MHNAIEFVGGPICGQRRIVIGLPETIVLTGEHIQHVYALGRIDDGAIVSRNGRIQYRHQPVLTETISDSIRRIELQAGD